MVDRVRCTPFVLTTKFTALSQKTKGPIYYADVHDHCREFTTGKWWEIEDNCKITSSHMLILIRLATFRNYLVRGRIKYLICIK